MDSPMKFISKSWLLVLLITLVIVALALLASGPHPTDPTATPSATLSSPLAMPTQFLPDPSEPTGTPVGGVP